MINVRKVYLLTVCVIWFFVNIMLNLLRRPLSNVFGVPCVIVGVSE